MPRTPRIALLAALASFGGLFVTGVLAYLVPVVRVRDSATLQGFTALNRPRLTPLLDHIAALADPVPYAAIGLALVVLALLRRRGRTAAAILLLLVVTGFTTESLKLLLAHPRPEEWLGAGQIAAASWPSGHATAAMTLALCGVLAAPARLRPTVAVFGALFAVAVSYALLALGWHFPSDVIGGFLVAALWTALAVAALLAAQARWPLRPRSELEPRRVDALGPMAVGAGAACATATAAVLDPRGIARVTLEHPTFVAGAAAIAALATLLAAGLARAMRTDLRGEPS